MTDLLATQREIAIAEFREVLNLSTGKPLGIAALGHAYRVIYAALGDKDQAFPWLEKADKARDGILARLKVDSRYDSLRSDPRFADLLRRVGLSQ